MSVLKKIFMIPKVIMKVKNWPTFTLDYLSLINHDTITYKMRNGLKFNARAHTTDRGIITAIAVLDEHGLNNIPLTKNSTIIDIGAQIGTFSIEAATRAGKVYSYEPEPENYMLLSRNIELNGMEGKIIPFRQIVWSQPLKKMSLNYADDNTGGHSAFTKKNKSTYQKNHSHRFEAPATTLARILDNNKIKVCDLMKIDVEGSEYPILYNTPLNHLKRIKRLFVEYHPAPGKNNTKEGLVRFLTKNGYSIESKEGYIFATRN